MPSRNVVKSYVKGGYYHIYNRGLGHGPVFSRHHDYLAFMSYLEGYFSPRGLRDRNGKLFHKYYDDVELLSFCLMPTHYHLELRQLSERGMVGFMHALITAFTMYKNTREDRRGPLFQGSYRASFIEDDDYALRVSAYIHNNPQLERQRLIDYPYSSLQYYASGDFPDWISNRLMREVYEGSIENYLDIVCKVEPQGSTLT